MVEVLFVRNFFVISMKLNLVVLVVWVTIFWVLIAKVMW